MEVIYIPKLFIDVMAVVVALLCIAPFVIDYRDRKRSLRLAKLQAACKHDWKCEVEFYWHDDSVTYYRCKKCNKVIRDWQYEELMKGAGKSE